MAQDTNVVRTFYNETFNKNIRVIDIYGQVWFVGKDVAEALGYQKPRNALMTHVNEEDKLTYQIGTSGQRRDMTLINEFGLYDLVLSSKLPNAIEFRRWVTHVVLPSIRKYGDYLTPENRQNVLNDPVAYANELKNRMEEKDTVIKDLQTKVDHYEDLIDTEALIPVTLEAKQYGMTAQHFNSLLFALHIQYQMQNGTWVLYKEYQHLGWVRYKSNYPNSPRIMYWTETGIAAIEKILASYGYFKFSEDTCPFTFAY